MPHKIWHTEQWTTAGEAAQPHSQCRPCLIQFLIIHFCPEHLCTTNLSPKFASFDISTSRQRPVSLLMIGPFCVKSQNLCAGLRTSSHFLRVGVLPFPSSTRHLESGRNAVEPSGPSCRTPSEL